MNIKSSVILLTSAILAACGGGGGSGDSNTDSGQQVAAQADIAASDAFVVVKPREHSFIDLSNYASDPNAEISMISNNVLDGSCDHAVLSESGKGIEITAYNEGLCSYQFAAAVGTSRAVANLQIFATAAADPHLQPISKNLVYSSSTNDVEIDLADEIAGWSSNYEIENIFVHGQEGVTGNALVKDGTNNTIVFTLPDSQMPAWNRIYYTVRDTANASDLRVGEIYVTLSTTANLAPTIRAPLYEYHVRETEFDYHFTSPGCTPLAGNKESTTCAGFSEFNKFEFQSARYLATSEGHVVDIQLYPRDAFHGKKVTLVNEADLRQWDILAWNSEGVFSDLIGRIVANTSRDTATTFTNVYGSWFRENRGGPLFSNQRYTLDLRAFQGLDIEDPEGHDWQLSHVSSTTAAVSLLNADNVTNKSIIFQADTAGVHYVNYVVNDHFGGFSSGIIKFSVENAPS